MTAATSENSVRISSTDIFFTSMFSSVPSPAQSIDRSSAPPHRALLCRVARKHQNSIRTERDGSGRVFKPFCQIQLNLKLRVLGGHLTSRTTRLVSGRARVCSTRAPQAMSVPWAQLLGAKTLCTAPGDMDSHSRKPHMQHTNCCNHGTAPCHALGTDSAVTRRVEANGHLLYMWRDLSPLVLGCKLEPSECARHDHQTATSATVSGCGVACSKAACACAVVLSRQACK